MSTSTSKSSAIPKVENVPSTSKSIPQSTNSKHNQPNQSQIPSHLPLHHNIQKSTHGIPQPQKHLTGPPRYQVNFKIFIHIVRNCVNWKCSISATTSAWRYSQEYFTTTIRYSNATVSSFIKSNRTKRTFKSKISTRSTEIDNRLYTR